MTYSFLFLLFTIAVGFRIAAAKEDPKKLVEFALDRIEDERDSKSACDILLDTRGWIIYMNEYSNSFEYIIIANVVPVNSNCHRKLDEKEIFLPSTCRIRVSTSKFDGKWFYGGHECKEGLTNLHYIAYPPPSPYYGRGYGGRYGGYGGYGGASGPLPFTGAPTLSGGRPFTGNVGPFAPPSNTPFSNPTSGLSAFDVGFFTSDNILSQSLFSDQGSNSVRTTGNSNPLNLGSVSLTDVFGKSEFSSSSLFGLLNSISEIAQPSTATDLQTPGSLAGQSNQLGAGTPFTFTNTLTGPQPLQRFVLTGAGQSPLASPLPNVPLSGVPLQAAGAPSGPPPQIVNS